MFSFDYIKIAQYRFTFIPDDFIIMPEKGKGNVIRGSFGTTLKRICCINQNLVDCKDCLDRSKGFKDSEKRRIQGFRKAKDSRIQKSEGFKDSRIRGFKWRKTEDRIQKSEVRRQEKVGGLEV